MFLSVSTPGNSVVRKIDSSGNLLWTAAYLFIPNAKSLSVDASELSVYYCMDGSPFTVIKLQATNGALNSIQSL